MVLENDYRPSLNSQTTIETTIKQQQCGVLIAEHLSRGSALMLDLDGVVFEQDSLDYPRITTPNILSALKNLESLNIKVGVATARSVQVVELLKEKYGLRMEGAAILEEGQVFMNGGKKRYFSAPNHPKFIADVRSALRLQPTFRQSWQEVKNLFEADGAVTFCPGNFQWQGECRASFWFFAHGENNRDKNVLTTISEPILRLARGNGIDFEKDLAVSAYRMSVGNLGIVSIKGKIAGMPINKGTATEELTEPCIFVADGFGDTPLVSIIKRQNGAVIGIKGNLDESKEPPEFLSQADYVLNNPEEFAQTLHYAAICLKKF